MTQTYTARVWKEDDLFIAQCAEIDVASHGNTEQEALANLREALELYLEPPTATIIPKVSSIKVEVGAP
ncbi:MAG: type II toxin-antitoxin system HicB family antitoxin [Tepidisphaeraceae bacterium]|jgi:predicted RNase H-like HicB family nuclease